MALACLLARRLMAFSTAPSALPCKLRLSLMTLFVGLLLPWLAVAPCLLAIWMQQGNSGTTVLAGLLAPVLWLPPTLGALAGLWALRTRPWHVFGGATDKQP